jgi:hypothetical protein
VSGVAEGSARGAALAALGRLDLPAPVERVVEPRRERYEIHARAHEVQRAAMRGKETT